MANTEKDIQVLDNIGKAWFTLRMYAEYVDASETRYKNCATSDGLRETYFRNLDKASLKPMLVEVLASRHDRLENKLGASSKEIVKLAKETLLKLL